MIDFELWRSLRRSKMVGKDGGQRWVFLDWDEMWRAIWGPLKVGESAFGNGEPRFRRSPTVGDLWGQGDDTLAGPVRPGGLGEVRTVTHWTLGGSGPIFSTN